MTAAIEVLDLPIQLFVVGTALGTMSALSRHAKTGEVDHWPVHVGAWSVALFLFGILLALLEALT
ncbi:MAG TPA: hypothetical protein VF729_05975 [Solirubrobacterales bacterium]